MVILYGQTLLLHRSIISISLEKFYDYWVIHENRKTFPPWMIFNILYNVSLVYGIALSFASQVTNINTTSTFHAQST